MKILYRLGTISVILIALLFSCSTISETEDEPVEVRTIPEAEAAHEKDEDPSRVGDEIQEKQEPVSETEPEIEKESSGEPLSPWTIYRYIFRASREGWNPVHRQGIPLLLFWDIDSNGYNDVFALYIDRESEEETSIDVISDFSRLYDLDVEPFRVECRLFFQRDGELFPGYSIDLGKKMVIDTMEEFRISDSVKTPFAFTVAFQNPEGTEKVWIFCRNGTYETISLRETFASFIDVRDINGDGFRDILHFEKNFEAGLGYETYITWYNWGGTNYRRREVTNILRNLHEFLDTTKQFLIDQEWKKLLKFGISEQQLKYLQAKRVSDTDAIQSIFIPSTRENNIGSPELIDLDIESVILPEILENPFQLDDGGRYVFPLRVRIVAENGEYLYISRIGMKENPFQPQQFYFIVMSEHVYY